MLLDYMIVFLLGVFIGLGVGIPLGILKAKEDMEDANRRR